MRSSTNAYLTALAITDLVYLLCVFWLSLRHYPHMKTDLTLANFYAYTWPYSLWLTDATSKYHHSSTIISYSIALFVRQRFFCSSSRILVCYSLGSKAIPHAGVVYRYGISMLIRSSGSFAFDQTREFRHDDHDDLRGWDLFVEKSMMSFSIYSVMIRFLLYFRCTH